MGEFSPQEASFDMQRRNQTRLYVLRSMAPMTLGLLLWASTAAYGQSMPATSGVPTHDDHDTKGWQIADMDRFLDSHPEVAEQLRKDPSLIRNEEFVENHPALQ